jgi:hypothetical protein
VKSTTNIVPLLAMIGKSRSPVSEAGHWTEGRSCIGELTLTPRPAPERDQWESEAGTSQAVSTEVVVPCGSFLLGLGGNLEG